MCYRCVLRWDRIFLPTEVPNDALVKVFSDRNQASKVNPECIMLNTCGGLHPAASPQAISVSKFHIVGVPHFSSLTKVWPRDLGPEPAAECCHGEMLGML